jgi:hypothetical protein
MSILNEPVALSDAINRILMAIKNDFLLTENTLVIRDMQGAACKNSDGSLKLECICSLVITG